MAACRPQTSAGAGGERIGNRPVGGPLTPSREVPYVTDRFKNRNVVERAFCLLKQWRGLATRYDKHAVDYRGARRRPRRGHLLATDSGDTPQPRRCRRHRPSLAGGWSSRENGHMRGTSCTATHVAARRTTADVVRQVTVLLGSLLAIAAAFVGAGAFGGPDQSEVGDGALAADATPAAPGVPAFSIWGVIYTGLLAYAVWQALPSRRADPRQRSIGWWVLGSMLLNALWITVVQEGLLGLSVPVIFALVAVLTAVLRRLMARPASGMLEAVVVDGTLGLYLGWVVVATVANVAAVLTAGGYTEPLGLGPAVWSWIVLLMAAAIGIALALYSHGRLAVGAAIVWGLAWIAVARTSGDLQSSAAATAAGAAAAAVALATIAVRISSGRRPATDLADTPRACLPR